MILKIKSIKDKFLEEIYEKSMKELDEFFELNWKRNLPCIFLVPDRKTINALHERETPDWIVGWTDGKDVYLLDKTNYEKESCHKYSDEEYASTIKHELTHSFTHVYSGYSGKPKWLWEGIAIYLSGQLEFKKKPEKLTDFLNFYDSGAIKKVYQEAGFAVEFLVKKYGKNKLVALLKSLKEIDSQEDFSKKFENIYHFKLDYVNFKVL